MADSTVACALMWLLLVAFVAGLVVALAPYVHAAWTAQTKAVAEQVDRLSALPLAPAPADRVSLLWLLTVLLPAKGTRRAEVAQ